MGGKAMPADDETDAIFEALQQVLDEFDVATKDKDVAAQRLLAVKAGRLEMALQRIELRNRLGLGMIMTAVRNAKNPEERRKELLNAFHFVAGLRKTAQDDLVDDDLSNEAEAQLKFIISGLDELEPEGRKALAPFLDSFNFDERVCAAVALLKLMPDRTIAVLRDLVKTAPGTNAGATAFATLNELSKRAK
jgi:hypothetical protein